MCLGLIWYARYVDSDSTAVTSRPFARTLMHDTHTHNTHTDADTATTTQRRSERACGNWSVMLLKMLLVRPVHDQALCQVLTNTHTGTHTGAAVAAAAAAAHVRRWPSLMSFAVRLTSCRVKDVTPKNCLFARTRSNALPSTEAHSLAHTESERE